MLQIGNMWNNVITEFAMFLKPNLLPSGSWPMKSLLLTEYKRLQLTEQDRPDFGDDDVLIRIHSCGICGSDVHGYDGSSGRRIPPLIMGHEAAGIVEAVGTNVTNVIPGDRVTFDSTISCGKCEYCLSGRMNLCSHRMVLGVSCGDYRRHGAFAEFVSVPARIVYQIPETLPLEHAAMIEAVSVAVHAVSRASIDENSTALVVGTGMIGLLIVQAIRSKGCRSIIAVDLDSSRLELAKSLGATETLVANEGDVVETARNLTEGEGVHVAFEVVGATPTVKTAVESTRKGGAVVLVGNLAPEVQMPLQSIVTRELDILGSCASAGEYPECIELMASGEIDVSPLISKVVPLEEGPDWFQRLYAGEAGLMKVILQP